MSGTPPTEEMPEELSPRRLSRRLVQLAAVAAVIAVVLLVSPGLETLRSRLSHTSAGWLAVGVACEVLSALSYVVIFRAVFCPRMTWRLSYQIAMAEQAANSVLPGIGRRTVALFFLTSMANVGGVIVFAALYAVGILHHDRDPALTNGFGAAALVATLILLSLPALLTRRVSNDSVLDRPGRAAAAARFMRYSLGQGLRDAGLLLRRRPAGVLIGSIGTTAFDLAVLGTCFRAFGYSPALGVLVLGWV